MMIRVRVQRPASFEVIDCLLHEPLDDVWNGKQSSGCGSLSSSTASTSELRYEHGRDS
jgi:hypothetical protein